MSAGAMTASESGESESEVEPNESSGRSVRAVPETVSMIDEFAVDHLTVSPGRVRDVLLRRSSSVSDLRLYLSTDAEAPLKHLEYCFGSEFDYEPVPERRRPRFNVSTKWQGADLHYAAEDLITLLNQTLSVPHQGALDLVTVLDWSATAAGRMLDSGHERQARTPGELMERAQLRATQPRVAGLAISALIEEMARVVNDHPAYRTASVIIGGPDSLDAVPNLRTQLAVGVAEATGKELIVLQWPAWQVAAGVPIFSSLGQPLSGAAIVVDDVWTDGQTMSAVGQLARISGADRAFGLAAIMAHPIELQHQPPQN